MDEEMDVPMAWLVLLDTIDLTAALVHQAAGKDVLTKGDVLKIQDAAEELQEFVNSWMDEHYG